MSQGEGPPWWKGADLLWLGADIHGLNGTVERNLCLKAASGSASFKQPSFLPISNSKLPISQVSYLSQPSSPTQFEGHYQLKSIPLPQPATVRLYSGLADYSVSWLFHFLFLMAKQRVCPRKTSAVEARIVSRHRVWLGRAGRVLLFSGGAGGWRAQAGEFYGATLSEDECHGDVDLQKFAWFPNAQQTQMLLLRVYDAPFMTRAPGFSGTGQ